MGPGIESGSVWALQSDLGLGVGSSGIEWGIGSGIGSGVESGSVWGLQSDVELGIGLSGIGSGPV